MTLIDKVEAAIEYIQDKKNIPRFESGDIPDVNLDLAAMNRIIAARPLKFPFVYMNSEYIREEIEYNKIYESDINLWIVNEANPDYTDLERRTNEIPYLYELQDKIKRAIEVKVGGYESYKDYIKKFTKEEISSFDVPVNVLRMEFIGANYQLIECLT